MVNRKDFRPETISGKMADKDRETIRKNTKSKKLKVNSYVEIKSGKFKGVKGTIMRNPEYDRHDKEYYYTVYNENRDSGLGLVTNIRRKNLKVYEFDSEGNIKNETYKESKSQSEEHHKPSHAEIDSWFTKAFGHKPRNDYYIEEWYDRFSSPCKVWSYSDYDRREALKKEYPEKFGTLNKDTNLNDAEYLNDKKYTDW